MSYPFYRQLDTKDCGPTCLRMVCAYNGKRLSQKELRSRCFTKRTGTSLLSLSDAAESLGLRTQGLRLTWEQFAARVRQPSIVQWNVSHFVVVYRVAGQKIIVGDPAAGILEYGVETFKKCWCSHKNSGGDDVGVALTLEPTPEFFSLKVWQNDKVKFVHVLKYLHPHVKVLVQLALTILLGSVLSLIFPFLTQSLVDVGIAGRNIHFIAAILIAQVCLIIGSFVNQYISNWLLLHTSTRVSISLIDDFLGKLMKLPISFFDKRMLGDILQRIGDFSRIEQFLTSSLITIVMAFISFTVYSAILLGYGKMLLLVFFTGCVLYIAWVVVFMKKRRKLDYMRFQESAANQSNIIHLINGMQEIKQNNCERQKRREWQNIQVKLYNINIKGLALTQTQSIGGVLIDQTKNVIISFIAASAVIRGDMTLGMMMAIQYIVGQMNTPLMQVIEFLKAFQDTKISMERVNEINLKEDEEASNAGKIADIPVNEDIRLSNVGFHYNGPRSPKVLQDVSFDIKGQGVTAIVGSSGSGKTTLIRLMLGFYQPTSGSIRIGGKDISDFNIAEWRRYCSVVMQEGFIFTDTITKNVALKDEIPDLEQVKKACETACLDRFISSLPLGYDTVIGSDGTNLSTGQKQRILIARAVYKNAPYIFLDEATNSLDAGNESAIMHNLDRFYKGKTVVVVAHRLSTVRNADLIIVMDKGRVVERGRHGELIDRRGYYYNLVKNQLELGT